MCHHVILFVQMKQTSSTSILLSIVGMANRQQFCYSMNIIIEIILQRCTSYEKQRRTQYCADYYHFNQIISNIKKYVPLKTSVLMIEKSSAQGEIRFIVCNVTIYYVY